MSHSKIFLLRIMIAFSGLFVMIGLIFQALAAHLPPHISALAFHPDLLSLAANALILQGIGAAVLVFCPLTALCREGEEIKWILAPILILMGTFLFSGSLALRAFEILPRNFIPPFGAILQMLGWIIPAFICISGMLHKNSC